MKKTSKASKGKQQREASVKHKVTQPTKNDRKYNNEWMSR